MVFSCPPPPPPPVLFCFVLFFFSLLSCPCAHTLTPSFLLFCALPHSCVDAVYVLHCTRRGSRDIQLQSEAASGTPGGGDSMDGGATGTVEAPPSGTLVSTLHELDQLVAALLDRDRYGGHIAALESTTQGVRLQQAHHRRTRASSSLRARYCSTSTLVRSLFRDCERQFLCAGTGSGVHALTATSSVTTPAMATGTGTGTLHGSRRRSSRNRSRRGTSSTVTATAPGSAATPLPSQLLSAAGFGSDSEEAEAFGFGAGGGGGGGRAGGATGADPHNLRFAGPDFTREETLSATSRQRLYNAALDRVEARYRRDIGDVRHVGRLELLRSLRSGGKGVVGPTTVS